LDSLITRTVCNHGIYLSTDITEKLGWNIGDEVTVNKKKNSLVLEIHKRYEGPRCVICHKPESKLSVNGREICSSCVNEIKDITSPRLYMGSLGPSGGLPPPP